MPEPTRHDSTEPLPASVDACHEEIRSLRDELAWLKRQLFGQKADRLPPELPGQDDLLGKDAPPEPPPADEKTDKPLERQGDKKKGHGRRNLALDESLPIKETVFHDVPEEEKFCTDCGCDKRSIGRKTSWKLSIIPARLCRVEHVRLQYACPCCQSNVSTADLPMETVSRGLATPELLAHVAVSKYADHLPLHRQEGIFARQGAQLPRTTLGGWLREAARELGALTGLMAERQARSGFLGVDETPIAVQARGKTRTAYIWSVAGDDQAPYTVFHFRTGRGRAGPEKFLKGFTGILQSDDYVVYSSLSRLWGLVSAGCWAHARRKFVHAFDRTRSADARKAVEKIAEIYRIEARIADASPEEKLRVRKEESRPLVEAFFAWLEEIGMKGTRTGVLADACKYALSNKAKLMVFLDNARVPMDNNAVERSIRPVVVGRKNWLFAGSDQGGETAAVFFSLIESAKRHGLNVFEYLTDVIRRLPSWPRKRLGELLPDRWTPEAPAAVAA